jgi:hypothetical protein
MTDRSQLTGRKHHLPEIMLDAESGTAVLQRTGHALCALYMHDWSCEACRIEAGKVMEAAAEIGSWDCDVALIIRAQPQPSPLPLPAGMRVLYDPDGKFGAPANIDVPGIVIADEWADISFRRAAGPGHEFPGMPRLISEVRYLATRCPECEGEAL